jgi:hypothetical protein
MADGGKLEVDGMYLATTFGRDLGNSGLILARTGGPMAEIGVAASQAFGGNGSVNRLAEADWMMWATRALTEVYREFQEEAGRGIEAMANAAIVCGATYVGTDAESAEKFNLIGFAFGETDRAPENLPKGLGQTLDEKAMAEGTAGDAQPDVLTGAQGQQIGPPGGGPTIIGFPDGSTRVITTGPMVNGYPSSVTTEYDSKGNMLNSYTYAGDTRDVTRISVLPGGDPKSTNDDRASKVRTQVGDDGKITVTTTVTKTDEHGSVVIGADGKPETTETTKTFTSGDYADSAAGPVKQIGTERPEDHVIGDYRKADPGVNATS